MPRLGVGIIRSSSTMGVSCLGRRGDVHSGVAYVSRRSDWPGGYIRFISYS